MCWVFTINGVKFLNPKMQLIVEPEAKSPSKPFNFNPDFYRDKRLVSQHCPPINAFFGLIFPHKL